jgi:FkbM family methyltransferase
MTEVSRPLILRIAPSIVRQSFWSRFYRPTAARFIGLFEAAPLHFASTVTMKLLPGDVISDCIAFTGFYEPFFSKWVQKTARQEGGVFVDVGANLGYFSLLWAGHHEQNRVVAFEASPRNVDFLQHNIRENKLADQIEVRSCAIGASVGKMAFDLGPADQTGWGGFSPGTKNPRAITVDVVPLDDALSHLSEIQVLKIDIEGVDFWALKGAQRLLREHRIRHVWWEENKPRMRILGISPSEPLAFMRSIGYEPEPQGNPAAEFVNWYARPIKL